jgi:hypothetical protein
MMTRTATSTYAGRASNMRRLRRRAHHASDRLFCRTNGCPSFLVVDPATEVATCPICGFHLRLD